MNVLKGFLNDGIFNELCFIFSHKLWNKKHGLIQVQSFFEGKAATRGVLRKKGVHRNLAKFTDKHLCQGLFFNIAAGLFSRIRTKYGDTPYLSIFSPNAGK